MRNQAKKQGKCRNVPQESSKGRRQANSRNQRQNIFETQDRRHSDDYNESQRLAPPAAVARPPGRSERQEPVNQIPRSKYSTTPNSRTQADARPTHILDAMRPVPEVAPEEVYDPWGKADREAEKRWRKQAERAVKQSRKEAERVQKDRVQAPIHFSESVEDIRAKLLAKSKAEKPTAVEERPTTQWPSVPTDWDANAIPKPLKVSGRNNGPSQVDVHPALRKGPEVNAGLRFAIDSARAGGARVKTPQLAPRDHSQVKIGAAMHPRVQKAQNAANMSPGEIRNFAGVGDRI